MALPNLAAPADLIDRNVDASGATLVDTMLAVASSVVRQAAASPILQATSTVEVWGWGERLLKLPGQPIQSVSEVLYDGTATTDFKLVDGQLWRYCGWGLACEPFPVTVTMVHGLVTVPPHIVQLVCDLAIAGMKAATEGARPVGVVAERIDDYSVSFAQGAEAVATAVELPAGTKRALRAKFGGGAGMVTYR